MWFQCNDKILLFILPRSTGSCYVGMLMKAMESRISLTNYPCYHEYVHVPRISLEHCPWNHDGSCRIIRASMDILKDSFLEGFLEKNVDINWTSMQIFMRIYVKRRTSDSSIRKDDNRSLLVCRGTNWLFLLLYPGWYRRQARRLTSGAFSVNWILSRTARPQSMRNKVMGEFRTVT